MKEIMSQATMITAQINDLLLHIKEMKNKKDVLDVHKKMKAIREYLKTLGEIDKMRINLLSVEIACIVRIFNLQGKIPGISKDAMEYFGKNGEDVKYYINKFPEAVTASQIWKAYKFESGMQEAKFRAMETGEGLKDVSVEYMTEEQIRKHATHNYYTVEEALKVIVDNIGNEENVFSVNDLVEKLPMTIPDQYRKGVNELCRMAISHSKIDTVGDKKAPKFVTYLDGLTEGNERWMRIPFGNASINQLNQMILLREEQLKQDSKALDNLKEIRNELYEMQKGKNAKTISEIIKANI